MNAPLTIHTGSRRRTTPEQPFLSELTLTRARVHEFCGPARRTLALMLAAKMAGPVFWILPAWTAERMNADGMQPFIDPARCVFITPQRAEDVLWSMEEALRGGIVPLVIADIPSPPALTPVRRLHLAAETGMSESGKAPLGVLLTGDPRGSAGVESRWRLDGAHGPDEAAWTLTRQRARTAAPKTWKVKPGQSGFTLDAQPDPVTA